MARTESVAIGGYYPTPPHLISLFASLLSVPKDDYEERKAEEIKVRGYFSGSRHFATLMDPCAGDGAAILDLTQALFGERFSEMVGLYTCELEGTRQKALVERVQAVAYRLNKGHLHGDAFRAVFDRGDRSGVSVLYLNPPYDFDPVCGRLEEKFLARYTPVLADGGVLLFVVPFHALKASADTLAREFDELRCFKFPAPDFDGYKQVVLYARRRGGLFEPDPKVHQQVLTWAGDVTTIPEFPSDGRALYNIPISDSEYSGGLTTWEMRPVDVTALLRKSRPWSFTTRNGQLTSVPNVLPDLPVRDILLRHYPVATPPRPAHIAAGIASGLFNGARIEPTDRIGTGLPSLLVKGMFDREYKTIEEKYNKDGEVRAVVQVQQPKLITTVLDLTTHKYHILGGSKNEPETQSEVPVPKPPKTTTQLALGMDLGPVRKRINVARMSVGDLLEHYGQSLMTVMERQCPILYDPRRDADSITVAPSPRRLFSAQSHAVRALVKLLGGPTATSKARKGKSAILLGEIGSGKSTVALMTARTIEARRVLIMCPPHLLKSWTNEIGSVLPDADIRVLTSVSEVDDIATLDDKRTVISILSREAAKLSHGWIGAGPVCPKCGNLTPRDIDLAKKRARCKHQDVISTSPVAEIAKEIAYALLPHAPEATEVQALLRGRFDRKRMHRYAEHQDEGKPSAYHIPREQLIQVIQFLTERYVGTDVINRTIAFALLALGDDKLTVDVVRRLVAAQGEHSSYLDYRASSLVNVLLHFLPPNGELQQTLISELRARFPAKAYSYGYNYQPHDPWADWEDQVTAIQEGGDGPVIGALRVSLVGGIHFGTISIRSVEAAIETLNGLSNLWQPVLGPECGEFLFQAVPEPRRTSLARYIAQRHPALFDFLVLDEGHEYATDGSAQERSAHRLTGLALPTVLMTGTIMNGYAESLFSNMWSLSPDFRSEFERSERQVFIDRYGYRKRIVEDKDRNSGEVVEYGSNSDRVTRSERIIGNAPGILPLFLLRHLLPIAVTLHKADLAIDLPACKQFRHLIDPGDELRKRFNKLRDSLIRQIKEDRFVEDLAGKLWGQLAELPSYVDRATADVGNSTSGEYTIRYPESVGGMVVESMPPLPATTLLPKEEWLLDRVESELAEGRNVMVFSWHVALLPRLARLLSERIGEPVPILYADKVATGKRQDWIDREVVRKKRRILVTNPVAIQTGLNNLVHFATEIWCENPACNPVTFRQAGGRVDRIGQTKETRIHFPIYTDTMQEQLYDLLMQKVAVSISTDGLDPESALQAAGVCEDEYLTGLSIGKQLWAMLNEGVRKATDEPIFHATGGAPKILSPYEMMALADR